MSSDDISLSCSLERPLCLNRPRNKGPIETNCDDTDYIPIVQLTKLLDYAEENPDAVIEPRPKNPNKNNDCYKFDLAWFTVIEDIKRRFEEVINPTDKPQATPITQEEMLRQMNETASKIPIDLEALFKQIVEVGKKRWVDPNKSMPLCATIATDGDCLANTIIDQYTALIGNEDFKQFSEMLKGTQPITTEDIDEFAKTSPDEKIKMLGLIEKLFTFTLPIMNPAGDLTNSLNSLNVKTVDQINKAFVEILELFKPAPQTSNGGKKKKSRRRKNKSKKKKSKKNRLKTKKYRFSKKKRGGGLLKNVAWYGTAPFRWALSIPFTVLKIFPIIEFAKVGHILRNGPDVPYKPITFIPF